MRTRWSSGRHGGVRQGVALAAALAWMAGSLGSHPGNAQVAIQLELPGSVDLLPPGDILADGTPQNLAFVVTDETGGFPVEPSFKFSASEGRMDTRVSKVGPGVFAVAYTPAVSSRPHPVTIKANVKAGKKTVERVFTVNLQPSPAASLTLAANPPQVVLDPGASTVVRFAVKGRDGQPVEGRELQVTANSGQVGPLRPLGNGQFEAVYTPSAVNFPHLGILAVSDARNPESTFGFLVIPLVGKVAYPVNTGRPGSQVSLTVGGQTYGPAQAGADGAARVPIAVAPGVGAAKVVVVDAAGVRTETDLNLQVPGFNRVKLGNPASWLPADGFTPIPVRVLVSDAFGRPSAGEKVVLTFDKGKVSPVAYEGNGVYAATVTPDAVKTTTKATLGVALQGEESISKDSASFDLVPGLARALTVATNPADPQGGTQVAINARLSNTGGGGLPGLGVELRTSGGVIKAKDSGDGSYTAQVNLPQGGAVLSAVASFPAGNRPPFALMGWALDDQVLASGKQVITLMAVDRYGLPVSGVPLQATLVQGGGQVAAASPTDANGRSSFEMTAGPLQGLAVVEVKSGNLSAQIPVWQSKVRVPGLAFPLAGGSEQVRLQQTWANLRFRREMGMQAKVAEAPPVLAPAAAPATPTPAPTSPSATPPPASSGGVWGEAGKTPPPAPVTPPPTASATPAPAASPAGAVKTLELTLSPATLPRDGKSLATLLVRALDDKGRQVPGAQMVVLTSAGTLVNRLDRSDGTASGSLQAPLGGDMTSVTVSAMTADGKVSAIKTLSLTAPGPSSPPPAPVVTSVPAPTPAPAPVVEASPTPSPTPASPRAPSTLARIGRIQLLYPLAGYSYSSSPCDRSVTNSCEEPPEADLDPQTTNYDVMKLPINATLPLSLGVDAEVFPAKFLGIGGGFTSFGYTTPTEVTTPEGETALFGDQLWNVYAEARGRITLMEDRGMPLDIMPRFGYHGQDILLFRWVQPEATKDDPNPTRQRHFETEWLHGLRLGLGLRFAPRPWIEPHLGYDATLSITAGGMTNHHLNVGVTFHPLRWLMVDASFDLLTRGLTFEFNGSDANGDGEKDLQRGMIREQTAGLLLGAGIAF